MNRVRLRYFVLEHMLCEILSFLIPRPRILFESTSCDCPPYSSRVLFRPSYSESIFSLSLSFCCSPWFLCVLYSLILDVPWFFRNCNRECICGIHCKAHMVSVGWYVLSTCSSSYLCRSLNWRETAIFRTQRPLHVSLSIILQVSRFYRI